MRACVWLVCKRDKNGDKPRKQLLSAVYGCLRNFKVKSPRGVLMSAEILRFDKAVPTHKKNVLKTL